jgi:hypothetical protein
MARDSLAGSVQHASQLRHRHAPRVADAAAEHAGGDQPLQPDARGHAGLVGHRLAGGPVQPRPHHARQQRAHPGKRMLAVTRLKLVGQLGHQPGIPRVRIQRPASIVQVDASVAVGTQQVVGVTAPRQHHHVSLPARHLPQRGRIQHQPQQPPSAVLARRARPGVAAQDGGGASLTLELPGIEVLVGVGAEPVSLGGFVELGQLLRHLLVKVRAGEELAGSDQQPATEAEHAHGGGVDAVALQLQVAVGVGRCGGVGVGAGVVAVEQGGDPGQLLARQQGADRTCEAAQCGKVHVAPYCEVRRRLPEPARTGQAVSPCRSALFGQAGSYSNTCSSCESRPILHRSTADSLTSSPWPSPTCSQRWTGR